MTKYHKCENTEEFIFHIDTPAINDNYVIWVSHGGNTHIRIKFCPFCGKKLNE
jgi:wobble nucleotide-excising tRNase